MAASTSNFSRQPRRRAWMTWLAAGTILLSQLPAAHADLNSIAAPRVKGKRVPTGLSQPTAAPAEVVAEVGRAGEVTIQLRGIARGGGQVEFALMQKPAHGKIVRSKAVGLDTLEVVYRHSGDSSVDTDSFVFGVRSGGIGPFSPGQARITVKDRPGRLLAPDELPFSATLVGRSASESFVVLNEGGIPLTGKITIDPPWSLQETPAYSLNPGQKRKLTILFTPKREGKFTGRLTFEGTRASSVELQGEGLGTFLASPPRLKLAATLDGKRRGVVSLQNNTAEPIAIEVESQLTVPKNVTLQFGETRELTIEDDGIGAFTATVNFKNGSYVARVEVSAAEAPARPATAPAAAVAEATPAVPQVTPPSTESTPMPLPSPVDVPTETPEIETPAHYLTSNIVRLSSDSIRIDWQNPPATPGVQYGIQQRYLTLDAQKQLQVQWVEVPSAKITLAEKTGSAEIDDLDAATIFTFRVVQNTGEPETERWTSLPMFYRTEPTFLRRLTWRSLLYPLAVILLGLAAWQRWRAREPQQLS